LNNWERLVQIAETEVAGSLAQLPIPLQLQARQLPVTFERRPSRALVDDGIEPDTLGLFVGEPYAEIAATPEPIPAQIILFLENLWSFAEESDDEFVLQVRTTYLHELGHYLGLDESDLTTRGLD
jgi:predicted Zn-dependent protease with MMP-like domain